MRCTGDDLKSIRDEAESKGIILTDEEYERVIESCERKMMLCRLDDWYMGVLLPDEIRQYAYRREVNKRASALMAEERKENDNGTDNNETVS